VFTGEAKSGVVQQLTSERNHIRKKSTAWTRAYLIVSKKLSGVKAVNLPFILFTMLMKSLSLDIKKPEILST